MQKHKTKIGILTLFDGNYNYGGILQACALCKILNDLGRDCKVLSYIDTVNPVYPTLRKQLSQYGFREILSKLAEKVYAKFSPKKFKCIVEIRKSRIEDFVEKYIPHTEHYDDKKLMGEYCGFDVLISGSDQVWNPNCVRIGFLQMFPHNNIRKVSYAASISRNQLSDIERAVMIPAINDFDYIAVRENTAKSILENYISKDIYITVDPTLLLERSAWDTMVSECIFTDRYVLCYFFSDSREYRKQLMEICRKNKLALLYIPFAKQEFNTFDQYGEGIMQLEVGPAEFLSLFKHASYIFTDSFHGAVFSMIFQKEFWVLDRNKESAVSMNSRLKDLLKLVHLSHRNISDVNLDMNSAEIIDYSKVNFVIDDVRRKSLNYLIKATELEE